MKDILFEKNINGNVNNLLYYIKDDLLSKKKRKKNSSDKCFWFWRPNGKRLEILNTLIKKQGPNLLSAFFGAGDKSLPSPCAFNNYFLFLFILFLELGIAFKTGV